MEPLQVNTVRNIIIPGKLIVFFLILGLIISFAVSKILGLSNVVAVFVFEELATVPPVETSQVIKPLWILIAGIILISAGLLIRFSKQFISIIIISAGIICLLLYFTNTLSVDTSEKRISGAAVTIKMTEPEDLIVSTNTTDKKGIAWFTELKDGKYQVYVHKNGYEEAEVQEFSIRHGKVQDNPFLFFYLK